MSRCPAAAASCGRWWDVSSHDVIILLLSPYFNRKLVQIANIFRPFRLFAYRFSRCKRRRGGVFGGPGPDRGRNWGFGFGLGWIVSALGAWLILCGGGPGWGWSWDHAAGRRLGRFGWACAGPGWYWAFTLLPTMLVGQRWAVGLLAVWLFGFSLCW